MLAQVTDPTPQPSRYSAAGKSVPLLGLTLVPEQGSCTETKGAGRGLTVGCLENSDFSLKGLFLNTLVDFKDLDGVLQGEL